MCEMCATAGVQSAAILTIWGIHGVSVPLCAECATQGGIYAVRAILPDGQVMTDEAHVGPGGRAWQTQARAEAEVGILAMTAADVGHDGVVYEAYEIARATIRERVAEIEAARS